MAHFASKNETLPALGLGSAPLGGLFEPVEFDSAIAAVRGAAEVGYGYVDTAPLYGYGRAEDAVGVALEDHPNIIVSTKVGRIVDPAGAREAGDVYRATSGTSVFDFSRDGVRRSLEESLLRLRRDRVDVVFIHDPDDHADDALRFAYPALEELRSEGMLTQIGVGMNQTAVPTRFVRETDIDVVLIAGRYTLLDQRAGPLLDLARDNGVSVVAAGVYNSGVLAPPTGIAPTFDYAPAPSSIRLRARLLADICERFDVSLAAAAVQFPLRHPAVSTVLIGARSTEQAIENLQHLEAGIPPELWPALDEAAEDGKGEGGHQ